MTDPNLQESFKDATRAYFESYVWRDQTRWLGVSVQKCPLDLWVYQDLLFEVRPDIVIETGTLFGGSALYLATVLDALDHGRVLTIDVDAKTKPPHSRIDYVAGSSVDPRTLALAGLAAVGRKTLVILDSDHSRAHVLAELRAYAPLVSVGSYLVVEDTCIGHTVLPGELPGPAEAVQEFLASEQGAGFQVDRAREKFGITFFPGGFLRRVS